jgi:hypothetical protein
MDQRKLGGEITFDLDACGLELMFEQRKRVVNDLVEIDLRELGAARAREVQQIVNDLGRTESLLGDLFQQA